MTKREVIKLIGKQHWDKFLKWMSGQTVSFDDKGEVNYYKRDVRSFITKLKTGYDRQEGLGWD